MMDSGGFSELRLFGKYTFSVDEYLEAQELHQPTVFVVMDWMCEPFMLEKTGCSIAEHQERTLENYLAIRARWDGKSEVMPVLQGYNLLDYLKHAEMYRKAGLTLGCWVGIGSICARQKTAEIRRIIVSLHSAFPDWRLHGFGVKIAALRFRDISEALFSADSMAWSFSGRKADKVMVCGSDCHSQAMNCANCLTYAHRWQVALLESVGTLMSPTQLEFPIRA